MRELISRRTENSKTYDLGKGKRRLESHIEAIHYKGDYADPAEEWKDIDLTVRDGKITHAPYILTIEGEKLTFKDKKTGEVSTLERTSVSPAGIDWEVIPENSAVRFRHTLPSDKIPFEAQFKITGSSGSPPLTTGGEFSSGDVTGTTGAKSPITRAFDDEGELELEISFADGILTEKLSEVRDKETGEVRPAEGNIRIDPTWQVGASSDDCYRRYQLTDGWATADAQMVVGDYASDLYDYESGMRFNNVTIPNGATIDGAYVSIRSRTLFGSIPETFLKGEAADDAATFSTAADYDARPRTTAYVSWTPAAWADDTWYNSSEAKTVIQEIIDRAGWASGNALAIFWYTASGWGGVQAYLAARTYDFDTTLAAKLVIEYTEPVTAPTVTTEAVDNIHLTQADGHGTITDTGGENAHTRGVCWNTTGSPTTADSKAEDDGAGSYGAGSFTKTMTGLLEGTTYYVRAYAINSAGTGYGGEVSFTTALSAERKLGHSPTRLIG